MNTGWTFGNYPFIFIQAHNILVQKFAAELVIEAIHLMNIYNNDTWQMPTTYLYTIK